MRISRGLFDLGDCGVLLRDGEDDDDLCDTLVAQMGMKVTIDGRHCSITMNDDGWVCTA